MQKKGKMFLSAVCAALIGLSCAACAPKEQAVSEQYDRETDMNLGIAAQEAVSPFLYGQFIEHIETCVYNGIWAEMVLDRKFYYEIGERGLSPWTSEGDVTSDASDTYSNGYAARIGAGGSISQEDISLEAKEYTGYFYARADEASGVRVALSADGQTAEASVDIEAGGWKKYEWSIAWAQESADASDDADFPDEFQLPDTPPESGEDRKIWEGALFAADDEESDGEDDEKRPVPSSEDETGETALSESANDGGREETTKKKRFRFPFGKRKE